LSSRIKTISLDAQTERIVKLRFSSRNFSKFVRECVLRYDALQHEATCPVERIEEVKLPLPFCVPSPSRVCLKHWPAGPARLSDWKLYRDMVKAEKEYGWEKVVEVFPYLAAFEDEGKLEGWIQHRAALVNGIQIEFDDLDIDGNAKPKRDGRRKKKLTGGARLMAFLGSKN